jgi:hypothetical protein
LHNLSASTQLPGTQDIPLRQGEDKRYEFRVPPGRYKLQAFSGGQWYVESATAGVTNLMTSELVIASGGSGTPIQIVANNLQGMVNVTVRLTPNADNLVLYFIPRGPSLAQVNPFTLFNTGSATASFSTSLPAGSYLAVVLDHPVQDDMWFPDFPQTPGRLRFHLRRRRRWSSILRRRRPRETLAGDGIDLPGDVSSLLGRGRESA